jgi:hypothetical protein
VTAREAGGAGNEDYIVHASTFSVLCSCSLSRPVRGSVFCSLFRFGSGSVHRQVRFSEPNTEIEHERRSENTEG